MPTQASTNNNLGLLSQYGFDTRTMEQKRQARYTQDLVTNLQLFSPQRQDEPAFMNNVRSMGTMLGTGAALRMFGDQEDPVEARKTKIVEDTNKYYKRMRTEFSDEFNALSPEEQAFEYLDALAQAASDNGDFETASTVALDAAKKRSEWDKASLERKKLGVEIDSKEQSTQESKKRVSREEAGRFGAFIVPDETGKYDFSNIEDNIVTGKVDENGNLIHGDGVSTTYMSVEDAKNLQKFVADKGGSVDGMSTKDRSTLFFKLLPPNERKEIRDQQGALNSQLRIMNDVAGLMEKYISEGRDPALFLDGAGRVVEFASNLASNIRSISNATFQVPIKESSDPNAPIVAPDANSWSNKYGEFINSVINVPPGIAAASPEAAQYRAAIVQLAYATARAEEPGARMLSDTDFRNALISIGAASANPETLRQTVLANMERRTLSFESRVQQLVGIGASAGLSEDQTLGYTLGKDAFSATKGRVEGVRSRFASLQSSLALNKAKLSGDATKGGQPASQTGTGDVNNYDMSTLSDDQLNELLKSLGE